MFSLVKHGKCFQFGVKRGHISRTCVVGENIIHGIRFVCAFYAFESPLFYIHCNCESNVIVNLFTMGAH
jgi:hypothetical protein